MAASSAHKTDTRPGMFGPAIHVEYGHKIKHNSPYLPDGDLAISIIGRRGSGKSTIMLHLLPQIANLCQIIICSRVCEAMSPVYQAIRRYCGPSDPGAKGPEDRDITFALFDDPATAKGGIEKLIAAKAELDGKADKPLDGLVIFDDFTDSSSARSNAYNSIAITITQILRNYRYHTMYITQSSTGVPTLVRNNTNVKIVFPLGEKHAIQSIKADFIASGVIDADMFDRLYERVSDHTHSYLMLVHGGDNNRLFIYVPGSEPDVPQLVDPSDTGDPADGDDIEDAREIVGSGKGPLEKMYDSFVAITGNSSRACAQRREIKERINEYARVVSRLQRVRFNDVIAAIHERFPELGLA